MNLPKIPSRKKTIYTESDPAPTTLESHSEPDAAVDRAGQEIKNVVIFGECGVGKSSLINLLADQKVSETSSGALGCTLEYRRHVVELDGVPFALWDTAGLDEGSQGAVPADKAESYLKQLLHDLAKNDGIDLLVYCVRGTRVRSALLTNYHIFYSAICRKKVPIAIVITGLENQEDNMDTWWSKNVTQFSSLKMFFDNYACVTTLEASIYNPILKERREISRKAVIKMVTSTCRTVRWKPQGRSWIDSAYSDVRAMLATRDGQGARFPTIIMCEASRSCPDSQLITKRSISFKNPVTLSLSRNPLSFRNPVLISNDTSWSKLPFWEGDKCTPQRTYRVHQVPPKQPPSDDAEEDIKKAVVVKRGAHLLIFCVSIEEPPPDVKSQWDYFHHTYGGCLSPQVVVVVGTSDQSFAEEWWKNKVGGTLVQGDVSLACCHMDDADQATQARKRLQDLIYERCIDCGKMVFAKNEKLFRRSLALDMPSLTTLWSKPEIREDEQAIVEQDILTKAQVWWDASNSDVSASLASPVVTYIND